MTELTDKQQALSLPSPREQHAIATILFDMDAEIATLEAKLSKARQLNSETGGTSSERRPCSF